ncbi:MAG: PD40 domain-containing protein [Flavobacteriales bacterium]|nr:PD40 domain-containing protein [Flavobacteriales bacterium]
MALKNITLLAAMALVACGENPAPVEDTKAPSDLRIAFNVFTNTPDDNYEVFIMDLDGNNRKNITNTPGVDWVYAAYGDRLLFLSDRDTCHRCYFLYEMDADGNNVRRISDHRLQDSWMGSRFNGAEFLVDPKGINDTAFFRISKDGAVLDTLYHGMAYANDPCFSPDGRQVVFRGAHAKFKQDQGYHDELYIINTDGAGLRQLTQYPANDTTAEWWAYHAGPPQWLAHDRISYCSKRKGNLSIFSVKPDGTDEQQLTPDGFDEDWHAWSPDGNLLVFGGTPVVSDQERPVYDIFLMDMRTKEAKRLTTDTLTEQAPVFVLAAK